MRRMRSRRKMSVLFKILIIIVAVILLATAALCLYMSITGKGVIKKTESDKGISEKTYIDVSGTKNGMIIRGENLNNPVLLFISGGPGVPEYWLNEYYDNKLEDHYTVCWWDYAGEGLSYDSLIKKEDISFDRLEKDAVTVVNYLKERFDVEKVYLMAHSAGTPLGISLASKHPDLFFCYFGMGQIVSSNRFGNKYNASYYFMKDIFEKNNDTKSIDRMNKLVEIADDGTITPKNPDKIQGKWENLLLAAGCATTRDMRSAAKEIFLPNIGSRCYTFTEKINYWKGKLVCQSSRYDKEFENGNYLDTISDEFKIPVYFISGYYDYTCPVNLVKEYYDVIEAPDKKMMIYENSAHSPLWEENENVLDFMDSVTEK